MGKVKLFFCMEKEKISTSVSIPYGKGWGGVQERSDWVTAPMQQRSEKTSRRRSLSGKAPLQKGKSQRAGIKTAHQFPMGKVKLTSAPAIPKGVKKYQFPMGKVKSTSVNQVILSGGMYQFPMGKVKEVILWKTLTKTCINSLWERLRWCPRAERLGNSTHATALREDEPETKSERQSATAKAVKSKRAYGCRTSIPYGKGKEERKTTIGVNASVSIPYGKGKAYECSCYSQRS